jgi:hypothetical protein
VAIKLEELFAFARSSELARAGIDSAPGISWAGEPGVDGLVAHVRPFAEERPSENDDACDHCQDDEPGPDPRGDEERSDSQEREKDDECVSHALHIAVVGGRQTQSAPAQARRDRTTGRSGEPREAGEGQRETSATGQLGVRAAAEGFGLESPVGAGVAVA